MVFFMMNLERILKERLRLLFVTIWDLVEILVRKTRFSVQLGTEYA